MKLLARYLKPFVGILLVCLVLLFGQAACDLSLPTLMSDMVNVGIQQSGLEAGAPEAMRQEGLQLLSAFAGEEDRSLLEGGYYTIEPGSSEAQRFAEDYPLVREEAVCVLREGQAQEELDALEGAYDRASYAMLLYFQQAAESGDLEQAAQNLAQSQLPTVEAPLPDGQTGLEGSQESFLRKAMLGRPRCIPARGTARGRWIPPPPRSLWKTPPPPGRPARRAAPAWTCLRAWRASAWSSCTR